MKQFLLLLMLLATMTGSAMAQTTTPVTTDPDKTPTAPAASAEDDDDAELLELLGEVSPEEMEQKVKNIVIKRLAEERSQAADEIKSNMLYKPKDAEEAVMMLVLSEVKTQEENIQVVCEALALADSRFTLAWSNYKAEKYDEVIRLLDGNIQVAKDDYATAALQYIYALSLERSKKTWDAIETYTEILVNQPLKICFASNAARFTAKLYEDMKRGKYAIETYTFCLENYGLTLPDEEVEAMSLRLEELMAQYDKPLETLSKWMDASAAKLEEAAFNPAHEHQQDTVTLLEDLIMTAEEAQRQKKKEEEEQEKQEQKPGEEEGEEEGSGEGGGSKPSDKPGNARDTETPGTGATESTLVPGKFSRKSKLAKEHKGGDAGKWAELSPRAKERIDNAMKQKLSKKRGGQVRDYHTAVSRDE
ncbi:MAG: hypothetical protein HN370_01210 [Phycisphaerales bacterium]|jgi:tetratricopeptide (TPR) repeat protein|nr:hypothetical protein [Phycisphaerales bacterium]